MVIHETVRIMLGYRPAATKQVPAMSAILLVVVMRMMKPAADVAIQRKRTGPLLFKRSDIKQAEKSNCCKCVRDHCEELGMYCRD